MTVRQVVQLIGCSFAKLANRLRLLFRREEKLVMNHDQVSNFRTIYEQYWLHARHCENDSFVFLSTYSVIITGIFAAIGTGVLARAVLEALKLEIPADTESVLLVWRLL